MNSNQYLSTKFLSDSYGECPSNIGLVLNGGTSFSIDAWIRIDDFMENMCVMEQKDIFSFGIKRKNLYFSFGTNQVQGKSELLKRGVWHFISMYYYKGEIGLYIDGKEDIISSIEGLQKTSEQKFTIGEGFLGDIRCIRVYDFPLTALMMQENMFNEPTQYVKAYLNFATSKPMDSQNKRDITMVGNTSCRINSRATRFDGFSCGQAADDDQINPGGMVDQAYSVQTHIYLEPLEEEDEYTIFSNMDEIHSQGLILSISRVDKEKYVARVVYGILGENQYELQTEIMAQKWVNLAVTYDRGSLKLFVDGIMKTSREDVIPLAEPIENNICSIGADIEEENNQFSRCFRGYMRNLDIWNIALDEKHIVQNVSTLPESNEEGLTGNLNFMDNILINHVTDCFLLISNELPEGETSEINQNVLNEEQNRDTEVLPEPFTKEELDKFRSEALSETDTIQEKFWVITRHRKDDRVYLVMHDCNASYTVMYLEGELANDEETIWWIELFFLILFGVLSIVVSMPIKFNQRIQGFIETFLRNHAAIRTLFGPGIDIGDIVKAIWLTMKSIVSGGHIIAFFKAAGFSGWSLLSMMAQIIGLAAGGWVAIAAKFTSLAISIINHIKKAPTNLSLSGIQLDSIRFNHDTMWVADAIAARKNWNTDPPEKDWSNTSEKNNSFAVYSAERVWKNNKPVPITVAVKFVYKQANDKNDGQKIYLRAVETENQLLGTSNDIKITSTRQLKGDILFTFPNHKAGANGITKKELSIKWQAKCDTEDWKDINTTKHTFYVILGYPTAPWGNISKKATMSKISLPWTDILDRLADKVEGIKTKEKLAEKITQMVNADFGMKYENLGGRTCYQGSMPGDNGIMWETVAITDFLDKKSLMRVNCTDCASVVSTLANIYGCNLDQRIMSSDQAMEAGFYCNPILAIGWKSEGWKKPFVDEYGRGGFRYHEVAAVTDTSAKGEKGNKIYDACLKVNETDTPWKISGGTKKPEGMLPVKMSFSAYDKPDHTRATVEKDSYREHLAENTADGVERCLWIKNTKEACYGRRPVYTGKITTANKLLSEEEKGLVETLYAGRNLVHRRFSEAVFFESCIPDELEKVYRRGWIGAPNGYMEYYTTEDGKKSLYLEALTGRDEWEVRAALYNRMTNNTHMDLPAHMNEDGIDIGFMSGIGDNDMRAFTVGNLYIYMRTTGIDADFICNSFFRYHNMM